MPNPIISNRTLSTLIRSSQHASTTGFADHAGFIGYVRAVCRDGLDWLAARAERGRQRRALRRLDAAQLKDIGLTPDDVEQEIHQPFWR